MLITCDTLRADRLGAYGYARPTSPNVDAFARESVVFDTAYTTAPWTSPALGALHTGKLPDEIGMSIGNRSALPADVVTLAEVARAGGCATAAIVSNGVLRRPHPQLGDVGFPQGFETFDDHMTSKEANRNMVERVAPDTAAAAIRWLDEAKRAGTDRFFLWVHFQDPHGPYAPPDSYVERLKRPMTDEPILPIGRSIHGRGQIPSYQALAGENRPEAYRARYDAEIAYFDDGFGTLVAALRRLGWYDDSLIVFTADHGESLGEHGYWFCHGANLFREEVRVPMVIRFPRDAPHVTGVASGRGERVSDLVDHLDLWPTILDALDLPAGQTRGVSLFHRSMPRDRVAVQTLERPGFPGRWEAVTGGTHRLLRAAEAPPALFDVANDPDERGEPRRPGAGARRGARESHEGVSRC